MIVDLPDTRRRLAESFADLTLADAMAAGAARGLRANHAQAGVFSSTVRDLTYIASQLEGFLANALSADGPLREQAGPRVRATFDPGTKLSGHGPAPRPLFSSGVDDVVIALPSSIEALRQMADRSTGTQGDWLHRAADVADAIAGQLNWMASEVAELKSALGREFGTSAALLRLAEQYCAIHAAACAVHLAVHSAGPSQRSAFPDGAVLLMTLEQVCRLFYPTEPVTDAAVVDRVLDHLRSISP